MSKITSKNVSTCYLFCPLFIFLYLPDFTVDNEKTYPRGPTHVF